MFTKSAEFYDAFFDYKDYAAESKQLHALLLEHNPHARTLLDVGCGTGKHVEHLSDYYQVEGLDLSADLLEVARRRCPVIPFHQANMVDFRLNRDFDVITCLFSSIGYVRTVENLQGTVSSMAYHLRPGGVVVVEPWFTPDNYWKGIVTAKFVDEPELKVARMYTTELKGRVSVFDINYLVGTPQGITLFKERHELGLFTHEEYLKAFRKAGLKVLYDATGLCERGMYLGLDDRGTK